MMNFDTDHLPPAEQARLAIEFAKSVDTTGWKSHGSYDGRYDDNRANRISMSVVLVPASRVPLRDQYWQKEKKRLPE